MNIEEGDKLIAEFMTRSYQFDYDLKYHYSWGWLMPVVEKIESLQYSVNILRNDCSIYDSSFKNTGSGYRISTKDTNDKIKAVYYTVIQFIEWYNKVQNAPVSDTTKA